MSTAAAPVPEASGSTNSLGRIFGALFSPKPAFESIVKRPTWILPLILIAVLACVTTYFYGRRVGWRAFMQKQIDNSSRTQNMPQEQKDQIIDQQTKYAPLFGYAGAVVFAFGGSALVAAIYMGAFNLVVGSRAPYKTCLAIVAYAWAPALIAQILGLVVLFIKDPATVDIQNLLASNAGAFLSDDAPKWLASLGASLDIFSFWSMALMGLGFSAINPKKISFGKAFGTVAGVWLIYVVVKVGFAAAFS